MREHRRKAEEQYNTEETRTVRIALAGLCDGYDTAVEEIIEWLQARCKHNMAEQIRKEFL